MGRGSQSTFVSTRPLQSILLGASLTFHVALIAHISFCFAEGWKPVELPTRSEVNIDIINLLCKTLDGTLTASVSEY